MNAPTGPSFTVAVAQFPDGGPTRDALAAAVRAAPDGADLVVLPYLGGVPYIPAALDRAGYVHARRPPHPTALAVADATRERGIAAIVSCYEVVGEGVFYSSAALLGPDGTIAGAYRQAHALNRPGQHEQLFFQPGNTGFPVIAVGPARIGLLLGGDLWVPEAARLLALAEAGLLVAITAAPARDGDLLLALARARAAENGRHLLLAARAGHGLTGTVTAYDPTGDTIPLTADPPWHLATFDLDRRTDSLRLRRPRLYASLAHGDEDLG